MGLKVVLASGREYHWLAALAAKLRFVDALVAENGAVVEAPVGGRPRIVGRAMASRVRRRLAQARWTNVEYGEVVVSVPRSMGPRVGKLVKGLDVALVPNADRVMILPAGVSKASGMQLALRALHLGSRSFAAIGDGENDIPLLREAALSGAVSNAHPRVVAAVDYVCRAPFGAGVEEFVKGPLANYPALGPPTPRRR
jgi:hydroxymethylpyrimidine pyrophosphatase-like HAD family hydrolase